MRARFSRWDSTQDPFTSDLDMGEVLDELADDLLWGLDGSRALERLQRRGLRGGVAGREELLQRLRAAKARLVESLDLSAPLEELEQGLREVLELERATLSGRSDQDARVREAMLDALPASSAGMIEELLHYDFASSAARSRFEALVEKLRRDVLDAHFKHVAGALGGLSPETARRTKDMLADLNGMLAARERGEPYDFEAFMRSHGDLFPAAPQSLDDLMTGLARRLASMRRLLAGLTPGRRTELERLAHAALNDLDLEFQMARLAESIGRLPEGAGGPGQSFEGIGDAGDMPISAAVDAIERLSGLDELESALEGGYPGAALDDVDEDGLRTALGDDAVRDLRRLKRIEAALAESDMMRRTGGRLELTARGAKLLGERSLDKLLARVRREPTHRARGGGAEPTGQTRARRFGDEEQISTEKTIYNALAHTSPGQTITLEPNDFEVIETESRPHTATAVLLDLSFSMPLRGHWVPAKRMALALSALIEGRYPQDTLYLIGFSDYARTMTPAHLASASWEDVHGTNMQHAFMLARRLLSERRAPVQQVMMVTDGEPTAHLDEDGKAVFNWPPVPETARRTLREAARLARSGIAINVFMLESSSGLVTFMTKLSKLTGGAIFSTHSRELSGTIVGDYLRRRGRGS